MTNVTELPARASNAEAEDLGIGRADARILRDRLTAIALITTAHARLLAERVPDAQRRDEEGNARAVRARELLAANAPALPRARGLAGIAPFPVGVPLAEEPLSPELLAALRDAYEEHGAVIRLLNEIQHALNVTHVAMGCLSSGQQGAGLAEMMAKVGAILGETATRPK